MFRTRRVLDIYIHKARYPRNTTQISVYISHIHSLKNSWYIFSACNPSHEIQWVICHLWPHCTPQNFQIQSFKFLHQRYSTKHPTSLQQTILCSHKHFLCSAIGANPPTIPITAETTAHTSLPRWPPELLPKQGIACVWPKARVQMEYGHQLSRSSSLRLCLPSWLLSSSQGNWQGSGGTGELGQGEQVGGVMKD